MKKSFRMFILCLTALALAACSVYGAGTGTAAAEEEQPIDLDLSVMSGTIVYAQIYNLMIDPSPWLGKTMKIAGYYSVYEDQGTGMVYHVCAVQDATACCAAGIEFVWAGEHNWPEEYPEEFMDITVTGRLEVYEENGYNYLHLVDAELVWDPDQEIQP